MTEQLPLTPEQPPDRPDDVPEAVANKRSEPIETPPVKIPTTPDPPPRPTIWDHDDGIIAGKIIGKKSTCDVCGLDGIGILVASVRLPEITLDVPRKKAGKFKRVVKSMKPHPSMIFFKHSSEDAPVHVGVLGITCGCLTRGHRQIARIDQRVRDRAG